MWWWPAAGVVAVAVSGALWGPSWALLVALVCVAALCGAVGVVIGSWRIPLGGTLVSTLLAVGVFLVADGRAAPGGDADLAGSRLRGSDLANADLRGASLRGADLRDSCLRGADLRGADLTDADFGGADVSGVDVDRNTTAQARNWPKRSVRSTACDP